jgi:hypothetical protein
MKQKLSTILGSGWNSTTEWKVQTALNYLKDKDPKQALLVLNELRSTFYQNLKAQTDSNSGSGCQSDFIAAYQSEYEATLCVIEAIKRQCH